LVNGNVEELRHNSVLLRDGSVVAFDIAVVCVGSSYSVFKGMDDNEIQTTLRERIDFLKSQHGLLKKVNEVVIVGGGPIGVELAGEIVTDMSHIKVNLIHGGSRLLDTINESCSKSALEWLQEKNVNVILNDRVNKVEKHQVITESGVTVKGDMVFMCTGINITTTLMNKNFADKLTERGLIKVESDFRVKGCGNIFAIGDCNNVNRIKFAYRAKEHAKVTANNIVILAAERAKLVEVEDDNNKINSGLLSTSLATYSVSGIDPMLVSIGRGYGVGQIPDPIEGETVVQIKSADLFTTANLAELGMTPLNF